MDGMYADVGLPIGLLTFLAISEELSSSEVANTGISRNVGIGA